MPETNVPDGFSPLFCESLRSVFHLDIPHGHGLSLIAVQRGLQDFQILHGVGRPCGGRTLGCGWLRPFWRRSLLTAQEDEINHCKQHNNNRNDAGDNFAAPRTLFLL